MKNFVAVGLGVLLSLAVGLLVVFGIIEPVFTTVFGLNRAGGGPTALPTSLLLLAAAFSFYFGGMAAGYRAPSRRRLHGTLVAPAAFAISPAVNLLRGEGFFPAPVAAGTAVLIFVFLSASCAASYVGARRGEALHVNRQRFLRRRRGPSEKPSERPSNPR